MEITINNSNTSKTSIEGNIIIWKIHSKKVLTQIFTSYSIGIISFVYGILTYDEFSRILYSKEKLQTQIVETNHYFNFHFFAAFGLVLILLTTVQLINYFKQKKIFFTKTKEISQKLLEANNKSIIKIDDEFVKSYSPNGNYEIKWESFSNYRICDNLILLNINTGIHSALIIDKRLINNEEMNHLLNIIDKKRILKLN